MKNNKTTTTKKNADKWSYKTTIKSHTVDMKKLPVDVQKRLTERKIKKTSIKKIISNTHQQLKNGKLFSTALGYFITLKDDKKIIIKFSNRVKDTPKKK